MTVLLRTRRPAAQGPPRRAHDSDDRRAGGACLDQTSRAIARPAFIPEKMQPPRNVPSNEL